MSLASIAVVIPTHNRPELLEARALASVAAQSRPPELLVVIDDSPASERARNQQIFRTFELPNCTMVTLHNTRTAGLSGALNCALDALFARCEHPEQWFVALLDDDDAWAPSYLETCLLQAHTQQLDMVAADIRRITPNHPEGTLCAAPEVLSADACLHTNPGIQGSNLFLRLSLLFRAGGFDEALQSTTDRDLCVRLADLGTLRYARHPKALVDHYADNDRARISIAGSAIKHAGLNAFWRKHHSRMTTEQRDAFISRASSLFDWQTPSSTDTPAPAATSVSIDAPAGQPFSLMIGVISAEPDMLAPLLDNLLVMTAAPFIAQLSVVVLANGGSAKQLANCVARVRDRGLRVALISEQQQAQDAGLGSFGQKIKRRCTGELPIAQARTLLQRYLGELLHADKNAYGWILDDDMRVDARAHNYLRWLPAFRQRGVDVLLGQYEGASPNPPLHGLRVQLVDLLHNLHWLRNLPAEQSLPDRSVENAHLRARCPDYYYDLARRQTTHLESPYWLEPSFAGESCGEALARLLAGATGVMAGAPLTRPLVVEPIDNPLNAAVDSVNRGGITFILNPDTLRQTPNPSLDIASQAIRRSDMLWAIINKHTYQRRIEQVGFPVQHLGRLRPSPTLDIDKVRNELLGAAVYAALCDYLKDKPGHQLDFTAEQAQTISANTLQHLRTRCHALQLSVHRIVGLRDSLQGLNLAGELDGLLGLLNHWFSHDTQQLIQQQVDMLSSQAVNDFVTSLRASIDDYACAPSVNIRFIHEQLQQR